MSPVQFDYTPFAVTYEFRPDYVPDVIRAVLRTAHVEPGDSACDIGAGSAHLTIPLLEYGLWVDAVEPNAAMRGIGERRTASFGSVRWHEGVGENTGQPTGRYALVTFGSSFDRTDQPRALVETARLLRPGGYFVCGWNHRVLDDPLQAKVEALIHDYVPDYQYGLRRSDPSAVIADSGLFETPVKLSGRIVYRVNAEIWCDAWRSHSTLGLQAGPRFDEVVDAIRRLVRDVAGDQVEVPYVTRMWVARLRGSSDDAS